MAIPDPIRWEHMATCLVGLGAAATYAHMGTSFLNFSSRRGADLPCFPSRPLLPGFSFLRWCTTNVVEFKLCVVPGVRTRFLILGLRSLRQTWRDHNGALEPSQRRLNARWTTSWSHEIVSEGRGLEAYSAAAPGSHTQARPFASISTRSVHAGHRLLPYSGGWLGCAAISAIASQQHVLHPPPPQRPSTGSPAAAAAAAASRRPPLSVPAASPALALAGFILAALMYVGRKLTGSSCTRVAPQPLPVPHSSG